MIVDLVLLLEIFVCEMVIILWCFVFSGIIFFNINFVVIVILCLLFGVEGVVIEDSGFLGVWVGLCSGDILCLVNGEEVFDINFVVCVL